MVHYKDIFLKSRWYEKWDWIGCEICWTTAVDVHHINSSARWERSCKEDWSDLISCCRYHHNLIHSENNKEMRDTLLSIVQTILTLRNWWELNTELIKLQLME